MGRYRSPLEYRGFTITLHRTGNTWTTVRWSAEALAADAPKLWSGAHQGRGAKGQALGEIKAKIDAIREATDGR
jgi:hypothetical protein